jgi:hypothetical protein
MRLRSTITLIAATTLIFLTSGESHATLTVPANWPDEWNAVGRSKIEATTNSVTVCGGFLTGQKVWDDVEMSFRARMPPGIEQVQIWGGFNYRDRDSRYVFALRGGHNNDLYLARYAPDGNAKFLGFAPLHFKPQPGVWYRLRVIVSGSQIQIYLNNEKLPRLNVTDKGALWNKGRVLLGGGWLPTEFSDLQVRPLSSEDKAALLALGGERWAPPVGDKEALRRRQRDVYAPVKVGELKSLRTDVPLDGDWLFMPDYQLSVGRKPVELDDNDQNWHIMQVPSFWTPGLSWLHGETSFKDLDEVSTTKGVASSLFAQENQRCDSYTFEWRKTSSAWYRHYADLPASLGGRRFELHFGAVAKVSEIWVNGIAVGTHTGMFGEIKCDVTKALKPGRNVIAIHVTSNLKPAKAVSDKVEGVAVTVEVTSAMLNSLPHGMFQNNVGGIWQPVKLTATAPILVTDSFIEPGLHGADVNLHILNSSDQSASIGVDYSITSTEDGSLLYSNKSTLPFQAMAGDTNHLQFKTPHLNPKLWSPQDPNLYDLEVQLKERGQIIDTYKVRFGFRTFTVSGNGFLLNGQPFWLRGANPFPNTLRPNDGELARRFIKIAREGNVAVTRSHIVPFTSTWLDAADELGMAVSFEGTWPWLMLKGNPPDENLLQIWKEEYIGLIHRFRNHPSIILWTVNNEMKFESTDQNNRPLLAKKWAILNDVIKAVREADPTRPVAADSSYVRKEAMKGYQTLVRPEHLDDGDVDDAHRYYGWYNQSFFHLYNGEYGRFHTDGRPFISQEMSTGYPNNDDGHPARFYLFKNYTPQALVGDDAYENADPALLLKRQAFMTKELTETLRRTGHEANAGVLLFSYLTWFQTPWSVEDIKPWPAYHALKTALQPVLVSAELYGRHFYTNRAFERRVCIINDSPDCQRLPASHLIWEFTHDGKILATSRVEVPAVRYSREHWQQVNFTTPASLPTPRVNGELVLRLEADGRTLSVNTYDITLATTEWTEGGFDKKSNIAFWNPGNQSQQMLSSLRVVTVDSMAAVKPASLLIVGDLKGVILTDSQMSLLRDFISQGGRALMLHPRDSLVKLFPEQVKGFVPKQGEIVSMRVSESPIFEGFEPLDLAWFERGSRKLPIACTGVYRISSAQKNTIALATQCNIHGYLRDTSDVTKISGTPLLEIQSGKGRILASELCLESGKNDPIAQRLLMNSLHYLQQ